MKKYTRAIAAGLIVITLPASADTFTLKDGTILEGSILRQDANSYVLNVNITKTIKDERVVAKDDVVKIEKAQPDLKAFVEIAKLVPVPDLLTADEYSARIAKVEKFLADNRGTSKSKEGKAILSALKEEANQILAGGIKLNGKFISPEEYKANAYEVDSRVHEEKIFALLKDSQRLKALRAYLEFNRDFSNTNANIELMPHIILAINAYMAEADQLHATFAQRNDKRTRGLDQMSVSDRNTSEAAIRDENSLQERQFKLEKDSGIGWVTLQPYCKSTIDETLSFGKQELARLNAQRIAPAVDGGKIYRETLALIQHNGSASDISAALGGAKTAKIAPRYVSILEEAAKASGIKR